MLTLTSDFQASEELFGGPEDGSSTDVSGQELYLELRRFKHMTIGCVCSSQTPPLAPTVQTLANVND